MNKKSIVIPIILALALGSGGYMLMGSGTDAVTLAAQEKGSIVTSDQVNISFNQVGGRITNILAQEEQRVKKGDVLAVIDPTDIDFQIAKVKTDIESTNVKIQQTKDSLHDGQDKINLQEKQAELGVKSAVTAEDLVNEGTRQEDIKNQEIAVKSAKDNLSINQLNYNRTLQLYNDGAASKASLDAAETQLTLSKNTLDQQQDLLDKLNNGARQQEKELAKQTADKANIALQQTQQSEEDLTNSAFNVALLQKQKDGLNVQLQTLLVQKERTILKAPSDGKVIRVIPKVGENIAPGAPVFILETNKLYYDFYVDETQIKNIKVGQKIIGYLPSLGKNEAGNVRFINEAPQFADLRMSREKGQSDLNSFQVRVYLDSNPSILTGMTVEVKMNEIPTR
jgi:multidrug resistance efflux pump